MRVLGTSDLLDGAGQRFVEAAFDLVLHPREAVIDGDDSKSSGAVR